MNIWHNDDYTISVDRYSRREDRPYVVTDEVRQWWYATIDEAMEKARQLDDERFQETLF